MMPLELVQLSPLMEYTQGNPEIAIALIDGPVALDHPELSRASIRQIHGPLSGACTLAESFACNHGTFVAGILSAHRGSEAPAICPGCTLMVRVIFAESRTARMPSTTSEELAGAIIDSVNAGAKVINLSASLLHSSVTGEHQLDQALSYAALRGVIIVAATGNQGAIESSVITHHPWIIPVTASNSQGIPMGQSNLSGSIGRLGLSAPGENITSLGTRDKSGPFSGTSAAAPFVSGTIALLLSLFPDCTGSLVKWALLQAGASRRRTISPPLLNAWAAYEALASLYGSKGRKVS
jgi:subtilisin family serine protease